MSAPHGTERRWQQHRSDGEFPCAACDEAYRAGCRRRGTLSRIRTDKDHAMRIPLPVLAAVLAGDVDALADYLGPDVADAITERVVRAVRAA
jgi:hypothetical protein